MTQRDGVEISRVVLAALFAAIAASTAAALVHAAGDGFAHSPLRGVLATGFWALKLGIVVAFGWFLVVRPPARERSRRPLAFAACLAAMAGAMLLQPPAGSAATAQLLVGEAVAACSAAWVLASVLALGRCFGVLPEARGLVTRGPYRLVRHPVYLGEIGMAAGLTIATLSVVDGLLLAAILGAQLVRMRLEEEALTKAFPEYAAYAAVTRRLLPRPAGGQ